MNFTNDPDPGNVKALLQSLRSSQAFAQISNATPNMTDIQSVPPALTSSADHTMTDSHASEEATQSSRISALLAKLRGENGGISSVGASCSPAPGPSYSSTAPHAPPPSSPVPQRRDVRTLTFGQAMPHLSRLSERPDFLAAVKRLKDEQAAFEERLWAERVAIINKHEEKVKAARARFAIINGSNALTIQEETIMRRTLEKELENFHIHTMLPAWDALVSQQQQALEALHVPTMFVTTTETDRDRQRRVMQVLEGLHDEPLASD